MIDSDFGNLTAREKDEFIRIINFLLTKTFILRDIFLSKEEGVRINEDYRFVGRHLKIFEEYLGMAGWSIKEDNQYGVIHVSNLLGSGRVRLDKTVTYILYVLRLIYEEEREKLSLSKYAITTVGDLVSKLITLGIFDKKLSNDKLSSSFSTLKSFNLIDKIGGDWHEATTRVIIYPSILFIVSNEKINNIFEYISNLTSDDIDKQMEYSKANIFA
jgi:hypothetical protein